MQEGRQDEEWGMDRRQTVGEPPRKVGVGDRTMFSSNEQPPGIQQKSRVPTWLRRQLAVHVEPPQKQKPVAFRTVEWRCIVYNSIP